ncbi:MAG: hypothetical protein V1933_08050 [Candidatus Omnitrophota bacterium]
MAQGKFTRIEAKFCEEALKEIMQALPRKKALEFVGHFNDIFLFLNACIKNIPESRKEQ